MATKDEPVDLMLLGHCDDFSNPLMICILWGNVVKQNKVYFHKLFRDEIAMYCSRIHFSGGDAHQHQRDALQNGRQDAQTPGIAELVICKTLKKCDSINPLQEFMVPRSKDYLG